MRLWVLALNHGDTVAVLIDQKLVGATSGGAIPQPFDVDVVAFSDTVQSLNELVILCLPLLVGGTILVTLLGLHPLRASSHGEPVVAGTGSTVLKGPHIAVKERLHDGHDLGGVLAKDGQTADGAVGVVQDDGIHNDTSKKIFES